MIEARCFGQSEIITPTGRLLPTSELAFAVALYFCVRAGERISRGELAETFWPHSDEVKGRHSLRQMLYRLKDVGFTLDEDGELLSLSPLRVRCDLSSALQELWVTEDDEATIAAACDALPALTRRFSERYGQWIDEVRARLESQFRRAALRVLADAKSEGRWFDVEQWSLMLLRSDPLNEAAVLARAEGTAMLGSKAEAITQLDRYLDELGPTAERIGLPAQVLRRRIKDWGERKTGVEALPLVGRKEAMRRITEYLNDTRKAGRQGLYLHGPPGIGKTRLLAELATQAELRGFIHLAIRLSDAHATHTRSALLQLGQLLLTVRGSIGADSRALGILERAVTTAHTLPPTHAAVGTAPITHADISWAVSRVLEATLEESRLLLTIDDAHHCSQSDLTSICQVMVRSTIPGLAWCLAGRPLPSLISTSQSAPPYSHLLPLPLKALSKKDSEELGQLVSSSIGRAHDTSILRDAATRSGGNPLFIIALIRDHGLSSHNDSIPRTLQQLIDDRVARLPPGHIETCTIVSILGNNAPLSTLGAVSSLSSPDFFRTIEALEQDGILTPTHDGAVSMHDCWRQSMEAATPPLSHSLLAQRIADYLERKAALLPSPDKFAEIGRIYAIGQHREKATYNYLRAASLFYRRGLCTQSIATVAQAEIFAATAEAQLECACLRACSEHSMGSFHAALETISHSVPHRHNRSSFSLDNDALLESIYVDASWKTGAEYEVGLEMLATKLAQPGISRLTRDHGCFIGLRISYNCRSDYLASRFWDILSTHNNDSDSSPYALLSQLVHVCETGSTTDIFSTCSRLRSSDISSLPLQYQLLSQRYMAQSLRWAGDYTGSLDVAHHGYNLAVALGLLEEAAMLSLQTCFTFLDQSEPQSALIWLERGMANSIEPISQERNIAIRHARSRLGLLESRFADVLGLLEPFSTAIFTDNTHRRRIAEGACLALAAAHCKRSDILQNCIKACASILSTDSPCLQNDFPATAFYRAFRVAGLLSEADSLLHSYCSRRAEMYKRPVAPEFFEIKEMLNTLSAN